MKAIKDGKLVDIEINVDPREIALAEIDSLKSQLSATDYKVTKCAECSLMGEALPYDIEALHAERQALRNRINELESQI